MNVYALSLSEMHRCTQLQVALEFGWMKRIALFVLARKRFRNAGDFIEYLEDNEDQLAAEIETKRKGRSNLEVAIEFGWCESIARRVLNSQQFEDAGCFIDFLEAHESRLVVEEMEEKRKEKSKPSVEILKGNGQAAKTPEKPRKEVDLREETELLYLKLKCLVCKTNKRSFVLMPCSHLTVCEKCVKKVWLCPRPDCNVRVTGEIRTYN